MSPAPDPELVLTCQSALSVHVPTLVRSRLLAPPTYHRTPVRSRRPPLPAHTPQRGHLLGWQCYRDASKNTCHQHPVCWVRFTHGNIPGIWRWSSIEYQIQSKNNTVTYVDIGRCDPTSLCTKVTVIVALWITFSTNYSLLKVDYRQISLKNRKIAHQNCHLFMF